MIAQNQLHQVIIQKVREQEKQQIIYQKWKQARVNLYTNKLNNKLRQAGVSFFQILADQSEIQDLEQKYREQLRRCSPIFQIIELQYTSLRTIKIQYSQRNIVNCQHIHPYSITAFQFFKVVYLNKLLTQIILKGILVSQFQQFIKDINLLAHNKEVEQEREQYTWMKKFSPSKGLKLSIDAHLSFSLETQEEIYSQKEDLEYFRQLFEQLSDIAVLIYLGEDYGNILDQLFKSLKLIKKLRMIICQQTYLFCGSQNSVLRSRLFGGLTSFTEIAQISFADFNYVSETDYGDYLAMEQSLNTLFANNFITHLTIKNCSTFPVLPKINTLKSIGLRSTSFRKTSNNIEEVVRTNPSLISIEFSAIKQDWSIDDKIINRLQTLIIRYCNRFTLINISAHTPSNIKCLSIQFSSLPDSDCFSAIFPKLVQLTKLSLRETDVSGQTLCSIPSQKLKEVIIYNNNKITNQGIQAIDKKWPYLKNLALRGCSKITEHIFEVCRFEGLISINADKGILNKGNYAQQLKIRGIKVSTL